MHLKTLFSNSKKQQLCLLAQYVRGIIMLPNPVLLGWRFIMQTLVDWTTSNTHFSSGQFIMQHITNTWGLQQCIVLWCCHKSKKKHMLRERRLPSCRCQQRQYEGKSLLLISRQMWWAATGQWCRLPLGQLLYSDDLQVWTEARLTSPHYAASGKLSAELNCTRTSSNSRADWRHMFCVYVIHCKWQINRTKQNIAGRSWSVLQSTRLDGEPGGEDDLLTLAVKVPDLWNYGPHSFNAVFMGWG